MYTAQKVRWTLLPSAKWGFSRKKKLLEVCDFTFTICPFWNCKIRNEICALIGFMNKYTHTHLFIDSKYTDWYFSVRLLITHVTQDESGKYMLISGSSLKHTNNKGPQPHLCACKIRVNPHAYSLCLLKATNMRNLTEMRFSCSLFRHTQLCAWILMFLFFLQPMTSAVLPPDGRIVLQKFATNTFEFAHAFQITYFTTY